MKNYFKLLAALALVGGLAACNKEEIPTDFSGGCEAVDLGITTKDGKPLKWASYNVGAQNVEGCGSYFAWGETCEKTNYDWSNEGDYKWGVHDNSASPKFGMTKYTADVEGGDGLKTLQPGDDPATANWGTKWRTPTIDEIKELLDEEKCEWKWNETMNGYDVRSIANGNSIFLPAAGMRDRLQLNNPGAEGHYMSSTTDEFGSSGNNIISVNILSFDSDRYSGGITYRCYGFSVRAVTEY